MRQIVSQAIEMILEKPFMQNKSIVRWNLNMTRADVVRNFLPSEGMYSWIWTFATLRFSLKAAYQMVFEKEYQYAVEVLFYLGIAYALGLLIWRQIMRVSVEKSAWWICSHRKVTAYRVILPHANTCPYYDDTPAVEVHLNNTIRSLMRSSGYWQDRDRNRSTAFWLEAIKLHAALRATTMLESTNRNYYQQQNQS